MSGLFDRSTLDSALSAEEKSALSSPLAGAMRPSQVIVDDSDYVVEHGRAPRGRGGWLFCLVDPRHSSDYLDHLIPGQNGTFKEARRSARAWAAARNISIIYVCA